MATGRKASLAEIAEGIATARHALSQGDFVDLAGLEGALAEICGAAPRLPEPERAVLLQQLNMLTQVLDHLASEMRQQNESAQRRRAAEAYAAKGSGG